MCLLRSGSWEVPLAGFTPARLVPDIRPPKVRSVPARAHTCPPLNPDSLLESGHPAGEWSPYRGEVTLPEGGHPAGERLHCWSES